MKHNGVLVSRFAVVISSLAVLILTLQDTRAAGVTLITHGLNGDTDGWITAMGNAIARYSQRTTNAAIFKFQFYYTNGFWQLYSTKLGGGDPLTTPGGEMVVLFDWSQLSDGLVYSTYNIADALAPALISTNFVPELGGHALAEFPLHLIGHSRGGSLICELSRLLGENGIWVDQVTTLDAHPLNNDGFLDLPLLAVDAPAEIYENVLFGDSYYQDSNLVIHGEPVPGSFWRQQTVLTGGYTDILDGSHSDIHLWYHGTIDLSTPTTDSEAEITSAERDTWWTSPEFYGREAGFFYSLVGGGDRLSTTDPNGVDSVRPLDGFNSHCDVGAGLLDNRTALATNNGDWPSPIRLNLTSTNIVSPGDTSTLFLYYQWAKPTDGSQTVAVYLDEDLNPLNGNERLLEAGTVHWTNATLFGSGPISVQWNATNASAGFYAIFVKFSSDNNSRYLYAPEFLQILPPVPPGLDIKAQFPGTVIVAVTGAVGQTMVLQQSTDLTFWQSLATNTLTSTRWETTLPVAGTVDGEFFRVLRQ